MEKEDFTKWATDFLRRIKGVANKPEAERIALHSEFMVAGMARSAPPTKPAEKEPTDE